LPAHEADHPAEDPALPGDDGAPGGGRPGGGGAGPPGGRADARGGQEGGQVSADLGGFGRFQRFDARFDAIIVGTGVAGLAAASALAPRRVALLTKSRFATGGSSNWAQGGIAAAVGTDDAPALHAADTLAAGAGLNDPEVVALLTEEGPRRIAQLLDLGAHFDRAAGGA